MWVLAVLTVLAMAKFFAHEIVLGQVNALLAVIVVAAVLALRRGYAADGGCAHHPRRGGEAVRDHLPSLV